MSNTESSGQGFSGKLFLVLLESSNRPYVRGERSMWALADNLTYRPLSGKGAITVHAGVPTDLASVPRFAWALLPPDGPWVKAAIIHDYLYRTGGIGVIWGRASSISNGVTYTRHDSDRIMLEIMDQLGIDVIRRYVIYFAVRIGGGRGWKVQQTKPLPSPTEVMAAIDRPETPTRPG